MICVKTNLPAVCVPELTTGHLLTSFIPSVFTQSAGHEQKTGSGTSEHEKPHSLHTAAFTTNETGRHGFSLTSKL